MLLGARRRCTRRSPPYNHEDKHGINAKCHSYKTEDKGGIKVNGHGMGTVNTKSDYQNPEDATNKNKAGGFDIKVDSHDLNKETHQCNVESEQSSTVEVEVSMEV